MDLFDHAMQESLQHEAPLADRMRPRILDEIVGQDHIIGEGSLLRRAIQADRLFASIILYGLLARVKRRWRGSYQTSQKRILRASRLF